jgi:hypothetical protein
VSAPAEHVAQLAREDTRRRAVAKLCGVSHELVQQMRPATTQVSTVDTSERTGQDGKQYPARRRA